MNDFFRALTEHLEGDKKPISSLEMLLKMETQRVSIFLGVTARLAPQLLSAHCTKPSAMSGTIISHSFSVIIFF